MAGGNRIVKKRMPAGESRRESRWCWAGGPGFSSMPLPPGANRPDTGVIPDAKADLREQKYCPVLPGSFTTIGEARAFCAIFFDYYNNEHRHSGIGIHTPASVYDGTAARIRERRQRILDAAYAAHPERFRSRPVAPKLLERAWINKPRPTIVTQEAAPINQAA